VKQIPQPILISLVFIAIIVVSAGIFVLLTVIPLDLTLIAGFAELGAEVNFTVESSLSISLPVSNVSFGSSSIGSTTIELNTTNDTTKGTGNPFSFNEPGAITIQNDGTTIINITLNGTLAADFIGGTSPSFRFNVTNNESNTCPQTNISTMGGPVEILTTDQVLCNSTNSADSNDQLNIDIFMTVPADVAIGAKTATITITASAFS
jgi:hypothetical protein